MKVTKRDGSFENYSVLTVKRAVREAFKSTKTKYSKDTISNIVSSITPYDGIPVEEIQDQIETSLYSHDHPKVAKEFILYRNKKKEIREWVANKEAFIERYKNASNTANSTIDDNSNVSSKNIGVLNAEIHKGDNILVSRGMITRKLKELFPDFKAKQYQKDLKNHIIYKNDESSFAGAISPYCVSVSMYPFLNHGLEKIGGLSCHPQNLDSYCGMYVNLVFAVAAQFAGAVATSEFLVYFDYFARKEFGDDYYLHSKEFYKIGPKYRKLLNESNYWCKDVDTLRKHDFGSDELNKLRDELVYNSERPLSDEELKEYETELSKYDVEGSIKDFTNPIKIGDGTRTIGSCIQQFFQQVVYSINQPAASRGLLSAFVNFSYFDKPFFEGMFGEFVFPDEEGTRPCFESVSWLQKNFMIWFNKERLRTIITFPVESFALVYKDGKFVDEDAADFVAEEYSRGHSFFTYMSDTVDSLSSCCFDGDTPFMFVEPLNMEEHGGNNAYMVSSIKYAYEKYKDDIINVYHMNFNGTTGKCTGEWVNAKFVKAQAIQEVRIYFKPDDFNPDESRNVMRVTPDHIFPVIDDNGFIRDKNAYLLQTGDQLIFEYAQYMGLFRDEFSDRDQDLVKRAISKVEIVNLDEPKDYYCVELCDKNIEPYFLLPNGNITHNCRLKNKIQTKEFNFTNGNLGIQTGSKSVITLNLSRITQDWFNSVKKTGVTKENVEEHYDELCHYFGDILDRVYKYHTAYNELLWDMYDAGLLPVYKAGFISLNKQYLTIGLNGLNQMAEFLGITCNINPHYEKLCQTIFGYIKQKNQEAAGMFNGHKLTFNTECVPAESLAIKNYNWDKEDGYWVSDDTNLYASYIFKPNDKSLSIFDKITLHGRDYIGDFLDGGSAAHLNLSEHLSKKQIKHIMQFAAQVGCQYWTFNVPNCKCEDCGYISKTPFDKCPKCGSVHISLYDRIIG